MLNYPPLEIEASVAAGPGAAAATPEVPLGPWPSAHSPDSVTEPQRPSAVPAAPAPPGQIPCLVEPTLVPLDDLLPMALRRIGSLERLVAGQQAQLNELVPLQRDILAMHSALCSQQSWVIQEHSALRDAYEALSAQHDALCDCLRLTLQQEETPVSARAHPRPACSGGAGRPGGAALPSDPDAAAAPARAAPTPCGPGGPAPAEAGRPGEEPSPAGVGGRRARASPGAASRGTEVVYAVGGRVSGSGGGAAEASSAVERFDPDVGRWEQLSALGTARAQHRVVALRGELFVVGGCHGSRCLDTCERFRPDAGRWEAMPSMAQARCNHDLAVLGGRLYATGGSSDAPTRSASVERFDPSLSVWHLLPCMSVGRSGHTSVVLRDCLYVVGGEDSKPGCPVACESFDPSVGGWTPLPRTSNASSACDSWRGAAVAGKLYVVASSLSRRIVAACECYDPDACAWQALPRNELLHICAATAEVAGKLYVFGKLSHQSNYAVCQCYDPGSGQWERLPPMPTERTSCQVLAVGGKVYVIGRCTSSDTNGAQACCVAERFDPVSRRWEAMPAPSQLDCQPVALVL